MAAPAPTSRPGPRRLTRGWAGALAAVIAGVAIAAVLLAGLSSSSRPRPHAVESIFQDDQFLLYAPSRTVRATLDILQGLGVDRIRLTIVWLAIAPAPYSTTRPAHFNASNPGDYASAAWAPYDRIVKLARARGIGVDFNLTAPGPLWAMAHPAPSLRVLTHYRPSPREFGRFVAAIGRRYSGTYIPRRSPGARRSVLPRVSYWTIWNEPNQPGWLSPQWKTVGHAQVMDSPPLYRVYVDAAFAALGLTGHGTATDTLLIGELAPEGSERSAAENAIAPLPFLRALYCVGADYRPLTGQPAALLHCPEGGHPGAFVSAHPGLFEATGLAHHPYSFFLPPDVSMSDPNFAPLSDLSRVEHAIDEIFAAYGVNRRLPIYLTEYGYETNPPNPFRGVSPPRQSMYLDQAQYIAWRDPRVRSLAQFLLYDSPPDRRYPRGTLGYWSTFQTGLVYQDGVRKASFGSYRLPIFVTDPVTAAGGTVSVWGMLRLAPNHTTERAQIQWRSPHGGYRTLSTVSTSDPDGFLTVAVKPPGSGSLRIAWTSSAGQVFHSRAVAVRVG